MLKELSPGLVGKVNKARLSKPAKSPAARKTLDIAVKKAWLKSKVGTIKEDGEGGPANHAGPATSTSDVHWSKRQPRIGMKGPLKKYGQPMIFKAVMRRKNVNEATVYYKSIGKRVKAVSRTSAMGNGSDGSGGNGGESVQREHSNAPAERNSGLQERIVKVGSKYRLVSKASGKNLGTYPSRSGAERRERQVQYFKHKG
jgi:hypothetical protein